MGLMINNSKNHQVLFLCVLLITALGFFLRFNAAVKQSFWQDEVYIFNISRTNTVNQILSMEHDDISHPQLYYLLSHWLANINTSPIFLRLPSLVASLLTLPLIYLIGKTVFGPVPGILSMLVFAVHPFYINQGFQAKMYGLVYLFVIGSLYSLILALKTGKFRWIITSAILAALSLYTDYSAIWYVISILVAGLAGRLIWKKSFVNSYSSVLFIVFLTIILYVPNIKLFIFHLPTAIHDESYLSEFRYWNISSTLMNFSGLWSIMSYFYRTNQAVAVFALMSLVVVAAGLLCFLSQTIAFRLREKNENFQRFFLLFLLISYFLPVFLTYAFSFISPIFISRNLWISGLIFVYGIATVWKPGTNKRLWLVLGGVYIFTLGYFSFNRVGFVGATNWKGLKQAMLKIPEAKALVYLNYEDPFWGRLNPLREYYLEGFDRTPVPANYKIYTIEVGKPMDINLQKKLVGLKYVWLLYSGDFLFGTPENVIQHQKTIQTAQRLLECGNKPCQDIILIYD